ncbi:hypothetical protein ACQJBY_061877 [Aegilops geniculata]
MVLFGQVHVYFVMSVISASSITMIPIHKLPHQGHHLQGCRLPSSLAANIVDNAKGVSNNGQDTKQRFTIVLSWGFSSPDIWVNGNRRECRCIWTETRENEVAPALQRTTWYELNGDKAGQPGRRRYQSWTMAA